MRLLVVGHPLIVAYNQKKYVAMKQIDPRLELCILGPKEYRHPFCTYPLEVHKSLRSEEVVPLGFALYRSHMTYLLDPGRVAGVLRSFEPDVIHLEEEPHSFIAAEIVSLSRAFAPGAAITLFTWDNLDRRRHFVLSALKRRLRAYSLRRAAAVVCGNRDAEVLLRRKVGYLGHTQVLPQFGLDPDEHAPGNEANLRQQLGLAGSIVVGFAGRLLPEKGILLLLGALAQLPELPWKLLLVGSGPLEEQIHRQWMPRFPGRIVHAPAVSHREVPRYLRCLDIFVLASYAMENWKEQFGLTLAQAMMLGVASVGSSSGAIPEVLGSGGLVVPEKNVLELCRALESLMANRALRQELGARARKFALRHYALHRVAKEYLAIFERAQRAQIPETAAPRRPPSAPSSASREDNGMRTERSPAGPGLQSMAELFDWLVRWFRAWVHVFIPHGRSPEGYRRAVRAVHRRLVYDPRMQIVTVRKGELAGAKKYGPFCDSDFDFALGKYEPEITAVFERYCRPGMTAFEIGAHAGYHTIRLAKLCGPSGRVHAFEPVPETFRCLQKTILLNRFENVTLHQMAVSDRFGEAQFQTSGVFDNFACLAEGGHGRSEAAAGAKRTIPVSTTDLDSFCCAKGISRVDLIKMDIEGAEMLALAGMTRTLAIHRPVLLLELWGAEHIQEAPGLLGRLGYETHRLSVWEGWVDGMFARTANVMALPISVEAGGADSLRDKRASDGDSFEAGCLAGMARATRKGV